MIVGIKDTFKLIGIILISACAVLITTLFLSYNIDLKGIEDLITVPEIKSLYDALTMMGTVVSAVSGGCLLLTSVVMLTFYIKHYIDSHRKELGVLKALGYSRIRIAGGFWVFGLSVMLGAATGFLGAHLLMPIFYSTQNEDGLLPEFEPEFHIELLLLLVILPTAVFALLSIVYGYLKVKTPVIELLKGKSEVKIKPVKTNSEKPFLKELRSVTVRSRKSLVFFIAFAAFCFSAMVQMSIGVADLSSELMSLMMLVIGISLALVTLIIAVSAVVRSNAKSVSIMRVFGYSKNECSSAVLGGYRPAAVIGFVIGTGYQFFLLKITVDLVFSETDGLPEVEFSFPALIIAAVSFIAVYETVMRLSARKIGQLSVKEIMLDSE